MCLSEAKRRPLIGADRPSIGSRMLAFVAAIGNRGADRDDPGRRAALRRILSATSSRCSPGAAPSATTRPNAATWTSRAAWPSIRSRRSWRGHHGEKVVVAGRSAESELLREGWAKRMKSAGCRSRTSHCRKPSKTWCGIWIDSGAARGVPIETAAEPGRPPAFSADPLAGSLVFDGRQAQAEELERT